MIIVFINGLWHQWTYLLRTVPNIAVLLEPFEHSITDVLIPAFVEHAVMEVECNLLAHSMCNGEAATLKTLRQAI